MVTETETEKRQNGMGVPQTLALFKQDEETFFHSLIFPFE